MLQRVTLDIHADDEEEAEDGDNNHNHSEWRCFESSPSRRIVTQHLLDINNTSIDYT